MSQNITGLRVSCPPGGGQESMDQEALGSWGGWHLESLVWKTPEKEDRYPALTQVKPWDGVTTEPQDRSVGTGCTQDVHFAGGAQRRIECVGGNT